MKHYFQTPNPDLLIIQKQLVVWFEQHEFEVDAADAGGEYRIQARKSGNMHAILDTHQAFLIKLNLSDEPNEFVYESTTGAWSANLTGARIPGFFAAGITWATAAIGTAWGAKIERDIVEYLETSLKFRKVKSVNETGEVVDTAASSQQSGLPDLSDQSILSALRGVGQQILSSTSPTLAFPSPSETSTTARQPSSPVAPAHRDNTPAKPLSASEYAAQKVQAELKKLNEAHEYGILSDQELAAKKKGLRAKNLDWEVEFVVNEKAEKLKDALKHGVLEQDEYESKLAALESAVRAEVVTRRQHRVRDL